MINKENVAVNVIANMQTAFGLYETVMEDDRVIDLRMLWANQFYLDTVKNQDIEGKLFSEIAPGDVSWIPLYGDVAMHRVGTQVIESYSDNIKAYIHVQAYSPMYGQVATIVQIRSKFVQSEYEKEYEEQKIRNMINLLPEGILFGELIRDNYTNEVTDIKCLYVNQALEIYEGIIVNTLRGKNFYALYPNAARLDLEKCAEAVEKKESLTYVRPGASNRTVEVSISAQGENQVFIVMRDITVQTKLENELKKLKPR
jgi:hypothetical protein